MQPGGAAAPLPTPLSTVGIDQRCTQAHASARQSLEAGREVKRGMNCTLKGVCVLWGPWVPTARKSRPNDSRGAADGCMQASRQDGAAAPSATSSAKYVCADANACAAWRRPATPSPASQLCVQLGASSTSGGALGY